MKKIKAPKIPTEFVGMMKSFGLTQKVMDGLAQKEHDALSKYPDTLEIEYTDGTVDKIDMIPAKRRAGVTK